MTINNSLLTMPLNTDETKSSKEPGLNIFEKEVQSTYICVRSENLLKAPPAAQQDPSSTLPL